MINIRRNYFSFILFFVALIISMQACARDSAEIASTGKCIGYEKTSKAINALAPHILFTDILSGPASGGEDDQGAYLSIYGFNFGSKGDLGKSTRICINGFEVASYKYMGLAVSQFAHPYKKIQRITVQVGQLNDSPPGIALPLHIEVNGRVSQQEHTFMIQPGDIYFVDNVNGDDDNGEENDISKPFRHVQTPGKRPYGAMSYVQPGDFIVMRGGKTWTDLGQGNRFLRFRRITGTRPTGESGDGPITVMGYPGEDVLIQCQDDTSCGIHGVDGYSDRKYEVDSDWVTISNLRIRAGGPKVIDGPINLQHKSDNWRIVNNELFDWDASDHDNNMIDGKRYRDARSGGITGDGTNVKILGNYIHDIDGGTRNHGIYIDGGAENIEIAFNHLARLYGGNIIQTYDSVGLPDGGSSINNIQIHHNLMHDGVRYGVNIADGTTSAVISNNLIYNTAYAGIRFSTGSGIMLYTFHNTLHNVCINSRNDKYAAVNNDWNGDNIVIKNNIVGANKDCSKYFYSATKSANMVLDNNIYYGLNKYYGFGVDMPNKDEHGINNDPLLINAAGGDFSLHKNSRAIDSGVKTSGLVAYDFLMNVRDSKPDIGAFEYMHKTYIHKIQKN